MKNILIITVLSVLVVSCAYNKTELPEPAVDEPLPAVVPDITYTNFVKTMVDNNHCLECHISGGTAAFRDYTTYSGIKAVATSGELKSRAIDGAGVPMPKGYPPLSQEIKDTLQMWIDQGALE